MMAVFVIVSVVASYSKTAPTRTTKTTTVSSCVKSYPTYAHMLIVVTFLVVNVFGFLVIARDHGTFEGRH